MDVRHCLYFDVIDREVPEGVVLKVGRFTDKVSQQPSRIAFKSKVVSRSHAEIWVQNNQVWFTSALFWAWRACLHCWWRA
jgi:hypothetical protein